MPGLCRLRRLQVLDIHDNSFEGTLLPCISNFMSLAVLDLHDNLFSGTFTPNLIRSHKFLQFIDISNNYFEGSFSLSSIFNHSKLDVVVHLYSRAEKANYRLIMMTEPGNIRVLKLGNNEFTGSLITKKEFYGGMEIFDVSNNNMDGKIPNAIAAEAPSSVSLLNLRDNRLSGNIPAQIGLLPGLRILLLGNNRFNGSIPGQLCELRNISIMDLSNNSFAGSIPSCLINVAFGTYPHDFFVQSTFSYWFSQEKFVPYIVDFNQDIYDDSSFWNSVQLEDALHSSESWEADIPSCTKLVQQSSDRVHPGFILESSSIFSVAHNNLSGRVPDKGQFATFGFNSYEGNPWLSGIPSEKNGTRVIETPFPSDELKKNAVLYINTYWRRWWSHFIEKSIYSFYFFVVDPLRKLATNFKHQFFT
ncbi:hypothetical protein F3Y22_tig00011637pilonHSYRG00007 [Hibiscus syriacus]|uniref:Uncharacterized protein n=1 Tax=Hibiscus syriacus TaxID=106335 RepID=A0A6A3C9N6_HIBSY|nr:hypothetical protein F3Y22_tig00011637pilonHSYRG00007 [Hibiscus syriacus]